MNYFNRIKNIETDFSTAINIAISNKLNDLHYLTRIMQEDEALKGFCIKALNILYFDASNLTFVVDKELEEVCVRFTDHNYEDTIPYGIKGYISVPLAVLMCES